MNYAKIWKPILTALSTVGSVIVKVANAAGTTINPATEDGNLATVASKITSMEGRDTNGDRLTRVADTSKAAINPATKENQATLLAKDDLLEWAGTAGAGYAGAADIDLTPSVAPPVGAPRYVDSIEVEGTDDGGSGAASVIVYLFRDSGATPGASKLILVTSASIPIAAGVYADRISPNVRPGFKVPAGQKLYLKVVPNANTITVSASAWTCAGR